MSRDQFKATMFMSAVTGVVLGVIICLLFGVMDVQCWNHDGKPNWSAQKQECTP